MAKMLLQEQYKVYLQKYGYAVVPTRTDKYIVMVRPNEKGTYFLGRAGTVRYSKTGKVSDSVSVTYTIKEGMRLRQKGQLNEE